MKYIKFSLFPLLLLACTEEIVTIKEVVKTEYLPSDTVRTTLTVTLTDTVYSTAYYIDPTYQALVDRFYAEATAYGLELDKDNLIVGTWLITDIQEHGYPEWYEGDGASIAYQEGKQWHVRINEIMREDRHFIAILRELGRALLDKPYADPGADDIMSPTFDCRKFTEREYDEPIARPYLDKLFMR